MLSHLHDTINVKFEYPENTGRIWETRCIFNPIPQRMIAGYRWMCVDQFGFISYVEQRDFEMLLGIGKPGDKIPWNPRYKYVEYSDPEFCGLQLDDDDIDEIIYMYEEGLRQQSSNGLLNGFVQWNDGPQVADLFLQLMTSENANYMYHFSFLTDSMREIIEPNSQIKQYVPNWRVGNVRSRWAKVEALRIHDHRTPWMK